MPRLTIKLADSAASGVTARLDDQPVKTLPSEALAVDPGEHWIAVTAPDHPEQRLTVTLAEAEKKEIAIGAFAKVDDPPPREKDSKRTVGFVVGGVGLAGLTAFGITGALMFGQRSIVNDHCSEKTRTCDSAGSDAAASGRTLGRINAATLAVGVVGVGVGAVLVFTSRGKSGPSTALSSTVYWTSKGKILSVARNAPPMSKAQSSVDVGADCLAVDATHLYWSVFEQGSASAINVAPIATPSVFTPLASMELQPLGLALGPTLYWSTYNIGGAIRSMTTAGADLKDLVPASDRVLFLAPKGNDLYWSYRGDATDIHGGVKKLVEGVVTEIARDELAPSGIAIDATDVYWIRYDGAVRRAPRAGGAPPPPPTNLAPSEGTLFTGEIALDTDVFYWTGLHTVWMMRKDGADSPHDFGGGSWTFVPALRMEGRVLYWTTGPDAQLMRKVKHAPP